MQRLRRLVRQRNLRHSERAFVVEGLNLLDAALSARAPIESIFYAPEARADERTELFLARAESSGHRTYALAPGVLERVSDTVSPQPVLGIVGFIDVGFDAVASSEHLIVCLDVRDPGNLGAIVRSADAAGIDGVVLSASSADCYNPKCVRASAGSLFRVPIVLGESSATLLEHLGDASFARVATVASGGEDYAVCDLSGKVALVVGNEAAGIAPELSGYFDRSITIPMRAGIESLNVAMAASVLMFELARRVRRAGT